MDYGDYLQLDTLLSAQTTKTGEHDELLFIVIHQATELWLKLSVHEIRAACGDIGGDDLQPAFKTLARVARIQAHMIQAWEILATMTPFDYANFRESLGASSGFQSFQYRQLEFLLGAKDRKMLELHDAGSARRGDLEAILAQPSLYDEALRLLARRGFDIPADRLERDWREPYEASPAVEAAWLEVYRNAAQYWDLYELGEKLVDLEYRLQQWRFTHMKTVERIIGFKRGTGGSEGVSYLVKALDRKLFPELLTLRTAM
ncbi:MAG TPA: tryptophan 2,3-dioxygenase family protein [Phenylobacterium sp.]|jgi:tryptophan 2,3-dioxygenase|uniref:tryptophan 2,3-dioxygenase n=1 Tax=Phenylobacterium sp. TaxID=1871053 RepID=UPI002D74663C|nr:tryptophan 2,3-dioxygenase family protein [Phenylobacterium sp.]HZZ67166.1 tryptophan 2,3-dioxygenase family protein [Phenylobacterium sp.]